MLTRYRTVSFQASWKCLVFFFLWITINYFILRVVVVLSLKYIPISRSSSVEDRILNFDLSNVSKINISSLSLTWGAFLFIDRFLSHRFTLYRLYQLRRRRSRFKELTRLSLVRPRQVRKGGWCGISVTEECFKNTHENDPLTMI